MKKFFPGSVVFRVRKEELIDKCVRITVSRFVIDSVLEKGKKFSAFVDGGKYTVELNAGELFYNMQSALIFNEIFNPEILKHFSDCYKEFFAENKISEAEASFHEIRCDYVAHNLRMCYLYEYLRGSKELSQLYYLAVKEENLSYSRFVREMKEEQESEVNK